MGKIQENLVLTDEFTAAFTRFLTLGESAVGATERINNSINMMGQSSNTIAAAGFNTLDQKITELSGKIQETTDQCCHTGGRGNPLDRTQEFARLVICLQCLSSQT